ncbi:MAG: hypothetical protein H6737_12405 [Alphaproteobacteria bacterium]|nr:hypothetical protein [Alphaproteobacteria bacterium]
MFDEQLRAHTSLTRGLDAIEAFLRAPRALGVAALADRDRDSGVFSYATDAEISLAEVMAHHHAQGAMGVKAAVELMVHVAQALDEVSGAAREAGLGSHGCLNPWRILLRANGEIVLLGYGIPDADLFAYLDGERSGVSIDTLRYAPPERLDDQEEDIRSDLYTLAIIGAELMLGRPVFDGPPEKVAERVINGDAPELIEALGSELGEEALDLLCVATERQPSHRFRDVSEFIAQARGLARSVEGRGLGELVGIAIDVRDDEPDDLPTDVAPLPSQGPPRDRPQADRPPPDAPSVHPEEVEDEDFITESGIESDFELVEEVPPLPEGASLDQVRAHARAVVERAQQLAEQAAAMEVIAVQRANNIEGVGPVVRKLKEAVNKAEKAASSTANTAKLVELDDTLADALVTLDMVRSAEKLCYSATHQALEILYRVQAEVDQVREQQQTLDRARRQSREAAERARDAARDAMTIAKELEATRYTVEMARDLLRSARTAASAATSAAVRAKQASQAVELKSHAPEAEREAARARAAADEAKAALESIRTVQRNLNEAESDARDVLASRMRTLVARARSAALSASQSMERAQHAATHATIPDASALLRQMEGHARSADTGASRAESVAGPALEAAREDPNAAAQLRRVLAEVETATELAEKHSADCGELSDRLVALAGEAAAAEAELAKWKSEARASLSRATDRVNDVRTRWEALQADTEEVTARTARDALQVAQRAARELEKQHREMQEAVASIESATSLEGLEEGVEALRESEQVVAELADRAATRFREARAAASRELEEIARRRAERAELDRAVEKARGHAERCMIAVRAAWASYEDTVEVLSAAPIDGADQLRARAYEIIDIAEYQAGEAETAAEAAAAQSDPDEARSHASTAESFEQRITEDLPEAMELLEKARSQATKEITRLEEARARIQKAVSDAKEAVKTLEELRTTGREAALDWDDLAVSMAMEQLDGLASRVDEDLQEVRYAAERGQQVENADDAWEMVPVAEAASKRLVELRTEGEGIAATLDAAVRTARQEIETREGAVDGVTDALRTIEKVRDAIAERAQALRIAVATHLSTGDEVREATDRMAQAVEGTAAAEARVRRAMLAVRDAATASEARSLQIDAEAAVNEVTRYMEMAAEAQSGGVSAAEREAVEREDSEKRQLDHARATALNHVNTAKIATEKGIALLREAHEQLAGYDDPEVKRLHERANEWIRVGRTAATNALKAARECQRAKVAVTASEWEQRANGLASDALNAVAEAGTILREAVDIARRAEQEAEALKAVKAEIQSISTMVEENIEQAEEDADRVREVTSGSRDPDTLACNDEADAAVQAVKRSAAKVRAAAPMALQADSLDVAQNLLDTCRAALQRADEAADVVRDLIAKAQQLLSQEEERAAQRLADARSEAERPAQEARAVAEKATGWVEIGRQSAKGIVTEEVAAALKAIEDGAEEVRRLADQAENAAQPARRAPNAMTAKAIGEKVRAAAERAERAADRVREALEELRSAVDRAGALEAEAQGLRIQAAEAAATAEMHAGDATAIAEELERFLSESGVVDDEAARTFREAKRTAKAIAAAAATAFERTEASMEMSTLEAVRAAVAEVEAKRAEAESQLEELNRQATACREIIDNVKRKSREDAKRQKDEALRAKLRQRRNESKIMKREELKAQFQERETRAPPNLSSLRERLRARRRDRDDQPRLERPAPVRPDTGAMPSPRRKRRRPDPDESSRMRPESDRSGPVSEPFEQDSDSAPRSREEREQSRQRREERRRTRRPAEREPAPSRDAPTNMGLITPASESTESQIGSEGADALLRRLRRKRREEN